MEKPRVPCVMWVLIFDLISAWGFHEMLTSFSFSLQPGDRWCLCASRWAEAYDEGVACAVDLKATHIKALDVCNLNALIEHALEPPPSQEGEGAGGGEGDEKEQSGAQKASAGKKEDL